MSPDSSNLKRRKNNKPNETSNSQDPLQTQSPWPNCQFPILVQKNQISQLSKQKEPKSFLQIMEENYEKHIQRVKSLRKTIQLKSIEKETFERISDINPLEKNVETPDRNFKLEKTKENQKNEEIINDFEKNFRITASPENSEKNPKKWGIWEKEVESTQAGFLESFEKQFEKENSYSNQKERSPPQKTEEIKNPLFESKNGQNEFEKCEIDSEVRSEQKKVSMCLISFENLECVNNSQCDCNENFPHDKKLRECKFKRKNSGKTQNADNSNEKYTTKERDSLKSNKQNEALTNISESSNLNMTDSRSSLEIRNLKNPQTPNLFRYQKNPSLIKNSKIFSKAKSKRTSLNHTRTLNFHQKNVQSWSIKSKSLNHPVCLTTPKPNESEEQEIVIPRVFVSLSNWQGVFKNYTVPSHFSEITLKEFRLRILLELDRQFPEIFDISDLAKRTEFAFMFEHRVLSKSRKFLFWLREKDQDSKKLKQDDANSLFKVCCFQKMPIFGKDKPESEISIKISHKRSMQTLKKHLIKKNQNLSKNLTQNRATITNFDFKKHSRALIHILTSEFGKVKSKIISREEDCITNETPRYILEVLTPNLKINSGVETFFARAVISAGLKKERDSSLLSSNKDFCEKKRIALKSRLLIAYPTVGKSQQTTVSSMASDKTFKSIDSPVKIFKSRKLNLLGKAKILKRLRKYKLKGVLLREKKSPVECEMRLGGEQIKFSRRFWFFDQTVEMIATRDLLRVFQTDDALTFVQMYSFIFYSPYSQYNYFSGFDF